LRSRFLRQRKTSYAETKRGGREARIHCQKDFQKLIFTINLSLRIDDPQTNILLIGIALSVVIATLLAVSGWYGGELTFRHKFATKK
jgi:hypothetical protein